MKCSKNGGLLLTGVFVFLSISSQYAWAKNEQIVVYGKRSAPKYTQKPGVTIFDNQDSTIRPTAIGDIPIPPLSTSEETQDISIGSQCAAETEKALSDCNFEGNSEVQGVMGLAGQLKNSFDQMVAVNPQLACSKLAQLSGAATAASGAFNGACSFSYQKCQSACEQDLATARSMNALNIDEIRTNQRKCAQLSSTLQNSVNSIAQLANVSQSMSYCQSQTGDAWAQHCQEVPSDPFCAKTNQNVANCSDPTFAASSTVCICQKNPSDPRCGSSNFASKNGSGSATDGSLNPDDFGSLGGGDIGGGVNDAGVASPYKPLDGDLNRGGSGRPGFGSSGGGTGGVSGRNTGGSAGSAINTKIVTGYGVGGRGGTAFGNGTGGAGQNNIGNARDPGNGRNANGVDLRQFLPGGQRDPSRTLAGVSGPDGITGPNTDIWKKINTRYFSVSPSLLP